MLWIVASGIFRSSANKMWARLTSRAWCRPLDRRTSSFSRSSGFKTTLVCRIPRHSNVSLFMCQDTRSRDLMGKRQIRLVRHYENRAVGGLVVELFPCMSSTPRTNPEDSFFAERNCDDRSVVDHVLDAIAMAPDVVTQPAVIPVQQHTI